MSGAGVGARPIRLLLVDDHEIVRLGLVALVSTCKGIEVVGEAEGVAAAVERALALAPDVVLMDLRLPDGSGVDACREILAKTVQTRVLFLTSYSDEEAMSATLLAGASGYLLKDIGSEVLMQGIEAVAAGKSILDPRLEGAELQRIRAFTEWEGASADALSPQERRVLALVVEGKTNREIGEALDLSDKTVKNYLSNAFQKLHTGRRAQAAAIYSRWLRSKE